MSARDVEGTSLPLSSEPGLANTIAANAESASNPAAANHFRKAATKLREAHDQDQAWLDKNGMGGTNSRV